MNTKPNVSEVAGNKTATPTTVAAERKEAQEPSGDTTAKDVAEQAKLREEEKRMKAADAEADAKGKSKPEPDDGVKGMTNASNTVQNEQAEDPTADELARLEGVYQERVKRAKERAKRLPAYSSQSDSEMSLEDRIHYLYGALPETLPDSHTLFGLGGVPFRAGDLRALVQGPKPV